MAQLEFAERARRLRGQRGREATLESLVAGIPADIGTERLLHRGVPV
jgi:hypothetical protein